MSFIYNILLNLIKSYNFSSRKTNLISFFLIITLNISLTADCDGNPITKKFRESDCDKRDIDVLYEIIEQNNLKKTSKTLFGNKKEVPQKPFDVGIQTWSYGRLIAINLENLNLSRLPESIGVLTTLEKLELSNNNLSSIPVGFGGLKPLKYLYLSNNQLESLPNSIKNLDRLRELDLSNNKLKDLPDNFGYLKSLKILDLNNNNLKVLPKSFRKFRNLIKLELSNNNISKLDKQISDLARLKEISIRNNKIISVPDNIGNLRNIERINLSGNNIDKIPKSIGNCYSLIYLNFSSNNLESIPIEIGQLNSLEELILNNNKISFLHKEYSELNKLVILELAKNKLSNIPIEFGIIKTLEELDLSGNNLFELPTALANLENLTLLKLDNNKITNLKLLNNSLYKIRKLELSNNPIQKFEILTENPTSVNELNLSGTGIENLSSNICQYSNAKILLENNQICNKQVDCIEQKIDRKKQYCSNPIIEYVEIIKEIPIEKIVEVEIKKSPSNDIYPNFEDPAKQKLFLSSSIEIINLETPDTLFALFESPYEYSHIEPNSNNFTYSILNTINQNGRKLNEFSFLELVGKIELLNDFKIQLYENLKKYSNNPYEYTQVTVWRNKESIEYKYGIAFSWLALSSWATGIKLKLNKDSRNIPFLFSSIVFKVIQKNLFDKVIVKKTIKKTPHFDQFLDQQQLISLAEKYNKKIFKEIKSIN